MFPLVNSRTNRSDLKTITDGLTQPLRAGDAAALATMDAHPRYYDAVRRGNVFFVSNSAAQALSTNSTTATGIIVYNPSNSGVNLAILEVIVQFASLGAGVIVTILTGGIQATSVTQTTTNVANGVVNALIGGGNTSRTTVGSSATIATAVIQRILPIGAAATLSGSTSLLSVKDEVAGALVIPPGYVTSLQCVTTAETVWGQISWEEIPV